MRVAPELGRAGAECNAERLTWIVTSLLEQSPRHVGQRDSQQFLAMQLTVQPFACTTHTAGLWTSL